MVFFSTCKINLGLNVVEKRQDGFHNIQSVFYPINWCDAVEFIEQKNQKEAIVLTTSGLKIEGDLQDNLLTKTYYLLLKNNYALPPLKVHLHKVLPTGAGLGGGSANAAFFLKALISYFNLKITESEQLNLAATLGADCAFFIKNKPIYAYNKGTDFLDVRINLSQYYVALAFPAIGSNTKLAYQGLTSKKPNYNLFEDIQNLKVEDWKNRISNDFEETIFKRIPETEQLKNYFYEQGALYASLSGSGSTVFGIFKKKPNLFFPSNYLSFIQEPLQ